MIPFHLAAPIRDKSLTRRFYQDILGCSIGREAERWIDFNFFGHQLSFHVCDTPEVLNTNRVDGKDVPVRHFGVVLPWQDWHDLRDRLIHAEVAFIIKPYTRFEGKAGEQATMFLTDPSENVLEFKSFRDPAQLFAR